MHVLQCQINCSPEKVEYAPGGTAISLSPKSPSLPFLLLEDRRVPQNLDEVVSKLELLLRYRVEMFLVHRKVDIDERPTLLLEIGESVYYLEIKDVVFIKDSLVLAGGVRGIRRSMLDAPLSGFVLILGYNYQNVMTATLLGTSEIIDDESAYDRIRFIVDALF